MREITFLVEHRSSGILQARSLQPALQISAPNLEELHHEAREALIQHYGPAHGAYRVKLLRPEKHAAAISRITESSRRSDNRPRAH